MTNRLFCKAFIVLIGWAIFPAMVWGETVDSLMYQSWRSHKPGTKVVVKNETSAQTMTLVQQVTYTLLEITPQKAVVELTVVTNMGGINNEAKARQDILARIDSTEQYLPSNLKGSAKQVGTETIDVGGKKVSCKVFEFTGQGPQGSATGKTWQTLDIPGGSAKVEMNVQGGKIAATIKTTVVSVESKQ